MIRCARVVLQIAVCWVILPGVARAGDLQVTPPRSLGMGGSLRGAAAGGGAIMLNPSGMSLSRSYVVESSYQYLDREQGHLGHISIVDSTSGFNIGGGLYYTYSTASPAAGPGSGRHEAGVALSVPFGDRVSLGGTVRYLRARRDASAVPPLPADRTNGFTFDAGITIRPARPVTIGLVGYGLRDLEDGQAPRSLGGGIAVTPVEALVLAVDGLVDFHTSEPAGGRTLSVFGGVEYTIGTNFAVRAGGGRGGVRERSFLSAGISALSEVGALDIGARSDLQGPSREVIVGVAGRLFVPSP